jgi:hypothetical protein
MVHYKTSWDTDDKGFPVNLVYLVDGKDKTIRPV